MRTKALLCAAALACGAISAMADNVYSLNVVGYVNVNTLGGANFTMVANPLNNANNNITNLFKDAQDGDQVWRYDPLTQDYAGDIYTYSTYSSTWDADYDLKPGEGIFYLNAGSDATITFTGDVIQNNVYQNPVGIHGGAAFNAIGSSAPLGGSFTNSIVGITLQDGDQVWTYDSSTQDYGSAIATYSTYSASWDTTDINIAPGYGFYYLGAGDDQLIWNRAFTVPQP